MNPRGTDSRFYKEHYYTLLHTKYESSGPCGFRKIFSNCKSIGANDPGAGAFLPPGAWVAGFIKRTTTHC